MNKVTNISRLDVLSRSVSIDLEVDPKEAKIFALAAVAQDSDAPKVVAKNNIEAALTELDAFCQGFDHVIGHNILRHDLPHLAAASPRFVALAEAPIDTLWLNPLAFPRNPYHHLVKHYQDGRLQTGHVNDPEFDARLVFEVLENQIEAFVELDRKSPDALTAYHFLCCRSRQNGGFDQLFTSVRGRTKPNMEEARGAIQRLLDGAACSSMLSITLDQLNDTSLGWPMAYALSWISVAGGDSVMPPWVRAQFSDAARIVRKLRDNNCGDDGCRYCSINNDPKKALTTPKRLWTDGLALKIFGLNLRMS